MDDIFFYGVVDVGVGVNVGVGVGVRVTQGQSTNTMLILFPEGIVYDFIVIVDPALILIIWDTLLLQFMIVNVFPVYNKLVTWYSQQTAGVDDGVGVGVNVGVVVGVGVGIGKQALQLVPCSTFNETTSDPLMFSATPI